MAGNLDNKKSDFVTQWCDQIDALLMNVASLNRMQLEAQVMDYGTIITNEDLIDANDYLTKTALVDSFQSVTAFDGFLSASANEHYASLYRVVR